MYFTLVMHRKLSLIQWVITPEQQWYWKNWELILMMSPLMILGICNIWLKIFSSSVWCPLGPLLRTRKGLVIYLRQLDSCPVQWFEYNFISNQTTMYNYIFDQFLVHCDISARSLVEEPHLWPRQASRPYWRKWTIKM